MLAGPVSRLISPWGAMLAAVAALGGCPKPRSTPTPTPHEPKPARTLMILTLNDFHGQLEPNRVLSNESPRRRVRIGGAQALVATVKALRSKHRGRVLLLDAGDFMQGSVLSNAFEGAPVRALYRALGVDAAAIGNHEFDYGPVGPKGTGGPDPLGALKAFTQAAPFPVLTANVVTTNGRPLGWPNLKPTALIERGGCASASSASPRWKPRALPTPRISDV